MLAKNFFEKINLIIKLNFIALLVQAGAAPINCARLCMDASNVRAWFVGDQQGAREKISM
ncbi:hypothetical protein [Burkholderia ubonensis]|uniref:hypothetical protein n=1 Tax=Burkholderia ubonensis TaxID=101571 RepID=UPI000B0E1C81|nr:hypothetical protein [Burkholderia ubonensis]